MMKRNRFRFIWLQLVLLFISMVAFGCHNGDTSSVKGSMNASDAGILISTSNAVPLYKDIHAACTVDIFYTKGMSSRDILSDPYFSFIKSMNFNSLQYSGGSTADHDHAIIGDTLVSGGSGDGYNMRPEDAQLRGEDFNTLLDGVGTVKFGVDFFNQYCALLRKLNIPGDIIANVQSGTLQELYWKIQQAHAKRVIFGMEQNLGSNQYDFADGLAYKRKITMWIDSVKKKFPEVITVIDAAPVYKSNIKFSGWNEQLQGIPGDEARMYLWDKDLFVLTENSAANLAAINQAFSKTIPEWFDQFGKTFPGKKVSVWQWGLKPKTAAYNNMLGCIYVARFYKFMIDYNKAHNNFIGYASFMSLKSLDRGDGGGKRGDAKNMAAALRSCGMLFSGEKKVDELTINGMNGVSGVACDENGRYTLLLINETGNMISIPSVKINGKQVSAKYSINTLSASSLESYDVSSEVTNPSVIGLKPYSVSVVEF